MSTRGMLSGFAVLAGTMLVTQLIGFVALAVAARELGPETFGAANLAFMIAVYFAIPANFGVALAGMRDVAREPERVHEIAGEVFVLRMAIAGFMTVGLIALTPVIASDRATEILLPIAALTIPLDALSGDWLLLGQQRSRAVAVARFAGQAVYGVLVIALISDGLDGAKQFVWFTLLSVAITAAIASWLAIRRSGGPKLRVSRAGLAARLRSSAPLGLAVVMVQVSTSASGVMLGYIKDLSSVGQFSVAQKVPLALTGVVGLWSATLYPQAARLMDSGRDALRAQIALFMALALALALPLAVGAALVATDLVPLMFGDAYRPAATAFAVLTLALAVSLLTVNVSSVLAAGGDERRYALGRSIGAATTIAVAAVAVPLEGIEGAAAAVLAGEAVVLAYFTIRYRRVVGSVEFGVGHAVRVVAATAVMAGALLATEEVGVGVQLVVAPVAYGIAAVVLRVIAIDDLRRLRAPAEDPAAG